MSNQTNVHLIDTERMLATTVGEALDSGLTLPNLSLAGRHDELLLPFLQEGLERIRTRDAELAYETEQEDLLELLQGGWSRDAVAWVATFETSWALADDLRVLGRHVADPLGERLVAPEAGGGFPASIPQDSPLRVFDLEGWQFFDREEFDALMEALERTRRETAGAPGDGALHEGYEEEWDAVRRAWRSNRYDLVLFWWLT